MDVKYINPFINVSINIVQQICNVSAKKGQIFVKNSPFIADNVVIIIGIAGDFRGQVFFTMDEKTACTIASSMMFGMEVPALDEMSKSAIAELGNMIMGNVSTEFYNEGITIDITPPTVLVGSDMNISTKGVQTICIPIEIENGTKIMIDIVIAN
ncbi:MAG: cheX1 [Clostridia bacterium]|jgi:chemotaxis protein CheX|nr:cheX1 [Clostridia bacterium]MDF2892899.1 cheX1 [Clostridia bacterium]